MTPLGIEGAIILIKASELPLILSQVKSSTTFFTKGYVRNVRFGLKKEELVTQRSILSFGSHINQSVPQTSMVVVKEWKVLQPWRFGIDLFQKISLFTQLILAMETLPVTRRSSNTIHIIV